MKSANVLKAKVSAKGWVVIPAVLRKRFGIKPGTSVEFQETGKKIVLIPWTTDPVEEFYGKLAGKTSLKEALQKDRERELKREETDICF